MKYNCEQCDFHTKLMGDLNRHYKTQKHIKNQKIYELQNSFVDRVKVKEKAICPCCNIKVNASYLSKHVNKCPIYKLEREKIMKDNEKDKQIELLHDKMEKLLINGSEVLAQSQQNIVKIVKKQQDNFKFVLENFKDAPDVFFPDNLEEVLYENMARYICMRDPVKAISAALLENMPTQPQEKRFIHGLDISRVKYMTKVNGKWEVDIRAKNVIPKFIEKMHKSCKKFTADNVLEMSNAHASITHNLLDVLENKKTPGKVARYVYQDVRLSQIDYITHKQKAMAILKNKVKKRKI